ncbi:MAG: response regulator [Acidobacteria bacterium]|nr:response regulator [Acidobacteriota bacterium]
MKPRVLVIEDNDQNLYLVTFLLEKHGLEVVAARDGRGGIEAATEVKPDLILLDIQLPVVDGYAVARALRANPELAAIPIVAVTSYAMVGDRDRCLEAGCTDYIEKPIDPEGFVLQIARHLPPGAVSRVADA